MAPRYAGLWQAGTDEGEKGGDDSQKAAVDIPTPHPVDILKSRTTISTGAKVRGVIIS